MKKHLSVLLTAAVITMLFTGCGGSSTAASGGAAPEDGNAETTEASVQEDESTEKTSPQEDVSTEAVSAQAAEEPAAPTGFRQLSQTVYNTKGLILNKYTYYEDKSIACVIINTDRSVQNLEDVSSQYTIQIYDREYDGEGKWISSTNYRVEDVTDLEGLNLDDYKTEENILSTDVCKYNDNGFIVESSNPDGNLIRKSTHNSQGQEILAEDYMDGKLTGTTESTYNEQGVLVKTVYKSDSFEYLEEYTPFGVTSVETLYQSKSGDNENATKMELHYDDNGILTSGDYFDNGDLLFTYSFELDEYGNILRIATFNADGSPRTTVENEIVPVNE